MKNTSKIAAISLILISMMILSACTQSIAEIKKEEYVGKTVKVSGTAENPIKLGKLSGYTVVDANGDKIPVASSKLPEQGDAVTAKGVLMKDTLLGYYIKTNS
jgi:hypothetical protein